MKRKTLKKALSAFLSLLMCMMTLLSISTPVFAATTVDAYMVDFPRDGDSNYSATAWGHSATSLMGGWRFLNSKYTTVHSIGTYNGQVSYCIEPAAIWLLSDSFIRILAFPPFIYPFHFIQLYNNYIIQLYNFSVNARPQAFHPNRGIWKNLEYYKRNFILF